MGLHLTGWIELCRFEYGRISSPKKSPLNENKNFLKNQGVLSFYYRRTL